MDCMREVQSGFELDHDSFQIWIPVSVRLPEKNEIVLVYNGDYVESGVFYGERGFWTTDCYEEDHICGVTHWMPLPEPPEVKNDA